MDSSLKICITGKFSDFAVRPLLSAGAPSFKMLNKCSVQAGMSGSSYLLKGR